MDPELLQLLHKYDRPTPRYTSYPPATQFHAGIGALDYTLALQHADPRSKFAAYVHVPFCEERCTYCGCFVIPTQRHDVATVYLQRLRQEILRVRSLLPSSSQLESIHLGGGTPTYLRPQELEDLFTVLRTQFALTPDCELAVEIDPRVTTRDHLGVLRRCGVRRVSLGVQDTSDAVQAAIGRGQSWQTTRRCFDTCRELGILSVNVDLVYGLPLQTMARFERTLEDILSLRPERLAIFGYAHMPWIRSNQKRIRDDWLPDPATRLHQAILAHEVLTASGYLHLGLDHFALPADELAVAQAQGRLGRSFMGYTPRRNAPVLGFGVSAIGAVAGNYFQNEKKMACYYQRLDGDELPVERGFALSPDDSARQFVIQSVLCDLEVRYDDFRERQGVNFSTRFGSEMQELVGLVADGLVRTTPRGFVVTEAGRLFLRPIASVFDRFHNAASSPQAFSQAV